MNDSELRADNIRALQQVYFAWILEELNAFQAADRLLELFDAGISPTMDRTSVEQSFAEWRSARTAISESDRRSLYTRVLGAAGGEDAAVSNCHSTDFWARFLFEVSAVDRQQAPLVGAIEKQVYAAISLLSHPEIRAARATVVRDQVRQLLTSSGSYQALPEAKREQIARDTSSVAAGLINAVDFPAFVAGLIKGTFGAIVDASIRQMADYAELIHDMAQLFDAKLGDTDLQDRLLKRVGGRRRLAQTRQQLLSTMVLMGINRVVSDDYGNG